MFILHSSNKTENLLIHLTTVIENAPLSNPLEKEVFLIQSQGMERWLSQQLADKFGVWGNYDFLFPGKFFSSIAKTVDQQLNDEVFDRELMLWRFERLLRDLDDDCFRPLQHYIQGENQALKRFQLAQQLAQIFDQYQMMRPDMLALWQKGQSLYQSDSERWQKALWDKVTADLGHRHRGSIWQDIISRFNQASDLSRYLPERIFVFGLNTMPPLFLDYLQGLSKHCDVHFFLLNPAQVYWADLVNKRQMTEQSNDDHPLLASLGQQGREFQQMLLEQASFTFEPESFEPIDGSNNLQQLQNDILNNQLQQLPMIKDGSISIHACHSRMREVEVLKNQLLLALEQDSELELRQIVVMAPDIQKYAPFISAVFSDIQHTIADKSLRLSNTLLDSFIRFLNLSQSRFGWQSVMDLLEQPAVYTHFDLSESDLELIKHWVAETHVRWGKSAEHKKELGLPEFSENTWQATLDRLLMGYAVGSEENFVDNVLPYREIEGSSALILGGFNDFIQLLFKASKELARTATLETWGNRLYYYADQLLSNKTSAEQLERQQLNELLEELSDKISAVHTEEVSIEVMVAWLESRVSEQKSSTGFLRGQLTFCSMLPMRSIPFKVIALLGLNEGDFPKVDRHPTFDLVGQNFRQGDRSRRADDRYQFLEVLLSARQQIIITFIGISIHRNDEIPPSVVISELLDVLDNAYQMENVVTKHPLQPFSRRYFAEGSGQFSFSQSDFETMLALSADKARAEKWWQGELETPTPEIIEINDLFSFFRHPQQYFLKRQMGIRLDGLEEEAEEREPFTLDNLEAYGINQQWIEHELNDTPFSLKKLQAQGRWISGTAGTLEYNRQQQLIAEFTDLIGQQNVGKKSQDQLIDIVVANIRLVGSLGNLYENSGLIYRYATLKGKDFMQAWLHHLIINQSQPQSTCLLSKDEALVFVPDNANLSDLEKLINIYLQGQVCPDGFFTEAGFAYVKQALKLKNSARAKVPAINAAVDLLEKELAYDRSMQLLYGNVADLSELLNSAFERQCEDLILPVWEAVKR
jgi:exodeoxyribonuclease V gamma subunit